MTEPQKRGNPNWAPGVSGNAAGRPRVLSKEKRTNKELRGEALMQLVRKLKPYQTKAVQAAVSILDNEQSAESSKLRASALILTLYKDLVKDLYSKDYDTDEGEEIQEHQPSFSLHVLKKPEEGNDEQ